MSTSPTPSETPPKNQLTSALLWTIGSVLMAAFAFWRGAGQDEKKTFYLIAGAIAVIAAAINGYAAWVAYNKTKTPPTA